MLELVLIAHVFSSVSETFLGEGCKNHSRKVLFFFNCLNSVEIISELLYSWNCFVVLYKFLVISKVTDASFSTFSRYDPDIDGRIILGKVDCTQEGDLCRRYVLNFASKCQADFLYCNGLESSLVELFHSYELMDQWI